MPRKSKFCNPPYRVQLQEERGDIDIYLDDKDGRTVAEWHGRGAFEMFEDGFFVGGRRLEQTVIQYAQSVGIISKKCDV
jgi:hypothetical protein